MSIGDKAETSAGAEGLSLDPPSPCCAPAFRAPVFRAPAACAERPEGPPLLLCAPHSIQVLAQLQHLLPTVQSLPASALDLPAPKWGEMEPLTPSGFLFVGCWTALSRPSADPSAMNKHC